MPIVAERMSEVDVAVIGAGAAGIAAARRVRGCGLGVLILEASNRVGGRAHTVIEPRAGLPLDLGCFWLHGARANAWMALAEPHGFRVDRTPAPWRTDTRWAGLDPERRADLERTQAQFYERVEQNSARERAMGDFIAPDDCWRGMLDAVSAFISGAELDRVAARDHADYDPGDTLDWRVPDGYGRLVATVGAEVPVMLETPATGIDLTDRHRVAVETPRGVLRARAAIVAVSTDMLAAEAIRFRPALPDKLAAAAKLPLGANGKIFLGIDVPDDFPAEIQRLGGFDRARTGAYHIKPFGRPIIECFYGGALARDLEAGGREAFASFALGELAGLFGSDVKGRLTPLASTAWTTEPFIRGAYAYAVPGAGDARANLAAPVEERLFFAGEACAPQKFTTAHGAYETGIEAADAALHALAGTPRQSAPAGAASMHRTAESAFSESIATGTRGTTRIAP